MYYEWVRMDERCKKMQAQLCELLIEKLRFESDEINFQIVVLEKKIERSFG